MKESYKVYLLGQFRLERLNGREWQTVTHPLWQHRYVRILLGYLLSSPGRRRGRERVMDELWPDLDVDNAPNRLNSTVHQLRQLLEPELARPASSRLLRLESDVLILADASNIWSDIDAFEHLNAQAQSTSDPVQAEQLLEEAVALYGGDFLQEERYSQWALARREVLQRIWIGLLLDLADRRMLRGTFSSAMDALNLLHTADPANEAVVRRLMLLLTQLDRRSEALQVYHRLTTALQETYGVAPLVETHDLFEAIRKGVFSRQGSIVRWKSGVEQVSTAALAPASTDTGVPHLYHKLGATRLTQSSTSTRPGTPQRILHSAVHIGRSHQSPLVGRTEELALMRQTLFAIEQLEVRPSETANTDYLLLLRGEAGIGKTRLAEELSREGSKRGWFVAWSRAYEQERDIPYRLWTEILRKALAMLPATWYSQMNDAMEDVAPSAVPDDGNIYYLSTLLPELHEMLSPGITLPVMLNAQEQLHLWEATRNFLAMVSHKSPLLVVLDDLHCADGSSLELLAYLTRQLHTQSPQRILLLGTCRDSELLSTHPLRALIADLQREKAIITLNIQPLTSAQIGALVAPLPEPIVQYIQTQASGNAFFAEELARYSHSELSKTNSGAGQQDLSPGPPINSSPLPETITAALDRRMSKLSDSCRRLLGKGAVLGGSFEFNLLCLMESSPMTSYEEDAILDLLDEALQAGVLTEESSGVHILYHFWHPMIVSHLYEQLSVARRAQLHRKAADALRQLYQGREEEVAAAITHHLLKGGRDSDQIAHYAEMAGNRAYSLSAYPEAQRHYQLAIAQITQMPSQTLEKEGMHLAFLQERLGECMMVQGNYDEAYNLYERVLEARSHQLFLSQAEQQREAQIQALLWYEMGRACGFTSNYAGVWQCNGRGEQVLRDAGVSSGVAWACLRLQYSNNCYDEGKYEEAHRAAQEALKMFEGALQQKKEGQSARDASHSTRIVQIIEGDQSELGRIYELLGIIAGTTGQIAEALTFMNTALEIFEQINNIRAMANACNNIGSVLLLKAEYDAANTYYRRSLKLAERVGDFPLISTVAVNLGELAALTGSLVEAESWYGRSMKLAEQVNSRFDMCYANNILTTNLLDQGNISGAIQAVQRALALAREIKNLPMSGAVLVTLANLRLTMAEMIQVMMNISSRDPLISRRLRRTQATLQHALALSGLRAEDMSRARLIQSSIYLRQGDPETAEEIARQTMEVVEEQQHFQSLTYAQRLLGCILSTVGRYVEADEYFQQALQTSQKYNMRLEYARALYGFGFAVVGRSSSEEIAFQQGLAYLQEAKGRLAECHATLDLAKVEQILSALR